MGICICARRANFSPLWQKLLHLQLFGGVSRWPSKFLLSGLKYAQLGKVWGRRKQPKPCGCLSRLKTTFGCHLIDSGEKKRCIRSSKKYTILKCKWKHQIFECLSFYLAPCLMKKLVYQGKASWLTIRGYMGVGGILGMECWFVP